MKLKEVRVHNFIITIDFDITINYTIRHIMVNSLLQFELRRRLSPGGSNDLIG